jgi:FkbM family methyltransferase
MARLWGEETGPCEGYEPETVRVFNAVLKEGDKCIIAGAHQGYFATVCARLVGQTGKVFAFEPEPKNFAMLSEACKGLDNVELFKCALGNRKANATFFVNSDNDGGHALWDVSQNPYNVETIRDGIKIKVEVNTLDDLFADRDMTGLKLLMLDAEGSEQAIIMGGIDVITDNDVPFIICEINNEALVSCGTSQMILRDCMTVQGYRAYWMKEDGLEDIGKDEWSVKLKDEPIVFNVLFSNRGEV